MPHWSEKYIGLPYEIGSADCARLLTNVRRSEFNKIVPEGIDQDRKETRLQRVDQMQSLVDEYGLKTDNPVDGDAVLMISLGRPSHIGVYCFIDGEPCVLHAMESAKMVVLHRLRDLPRLSLSVEGFYTWK